MGNILIPILIVLGALFIKNKFDDETPHSKRHRSCYGADDKKKSAYKTEDDALAWARKQKIPLRCYLCPDCDYYHLTKKTLT